MLLVRHVMAEVPEIVEPTTTIHQVARLMEKHDVGSIPVVDAEGLVHGIVTDRDLVVRAVASHRDPEQTPVADVMTRDELVTISPDAQVSEARDLMAERKVRRLL